MVPSNSRGVDYTNVASKEDGEVSSGSNSKDDNKGNRQHRTVVVLFGSLFVIGLMYRYGSTKAVNRDEIWSIWPSTNNDHLIDSATNYTVQSSTEDNPLECSQWVIPKSTNQNTQTHCQDLSQSIKSGSSKDFSVKICMSEKVCGLGHVLIEKKGNCQSDLAKKLSFSRKTDKWLKELNGPDAFYLAFTGMQHEVVSDWLHLGDCTYKLPFQLYNPGIYHLILNHVYDNYVAVDETLLLEYPMPIDNIILETAIIIDCPHCETYTAKFLDNMANDLPLCSRTSPNHGVYLHMTNDSKREQNRLEAYKIPYIWAPVGCKYDQRFDDGIPESCLVDEATAKLTDRTRRVLLLGDSQIRFTWDSVDQRMAGIFEPMRTEKGAAKSNSYELDKPRRVWNHSVPDHTISSTQVAAWIKFQWASHLAPMTNYEKDAANVPETAKEPRTTVDELMDGIDALVFDAGHWASAGTTLGGEFKYRRWKAFMEFVAEALLQANQNRSRKGLKPIKIIWHGIMSFPINTDRNHPVFKSGDWRTFVRLRVWGDIAAEVMRERGIDIQIAADRLSLPWIHHSPDGNHFHTTPALDAVTDELLHKLNFCGY